MESNSTATPGTQSPNTGTNFTSPVFILPLTISLAILVAIVVVGCAIYCKRQRKRTQELTRRLRFTERRIDAIGNLKAKKEKKLAAQKADYLPPTSLQDVSLSNSSLHVSTFEDRAHSVRTRSSRPHNFYLSTQEEDKQEKRRVPPSSATQAADRRRIKSAGELSLASAHLEQCHPNPVPSSEPESYCSTCYNPSAPHFQSSTAHTLVEIADSSLAVECETIPSVSSLSTVHTGIKVHNPWQQPKIRPSHIINPSSSMVPGNPTAQRHPPKMSTLAPSATSGHSMSTTGTWGSAVNMVGPLPSQVAINNTTNLLWPTGEFTTPASEDEGRPNTPVTNSTTTECSSVIRTEGQTSEGQEEKWV